jgi:hypothetical protein
MKKLYALLASLTLVTVVPTSTTAAPTDAPNRSVEPIVLTGAQLPGWSGPASDGVSEPHPSGALQVRDAHNGTTFVPPKETWSTINPDEVVAFSFQDGKWREIPVQVDERFHYFLANANSDFGVYSGTDKELSYEWDVESWKKTAGECFTEYEEGDGPTQDPVLTLDDDDEVVFMASDAGAQAPPTSAPSDVGDARQEVKITDPADPTSVRYVYLFTREGGPDIDADDYYVDYQRDENADQWVDRSFWAGDDPEKLGTSNRGYGPNLSGPVCDEQVDPETGEVTYVPKTTPPSENDPGGQPYVSDDRFPRDGLTVTTDAYRWVATGRWMIREIHVAKPGSGTPQPPGNSGQHSNPGQGFGPGGHASPNALKTKVEYGPDLIDRWKGRAFQQSPDSSISLVGFEDEQVNWEANSALLGELSGPVRAIREVWGADSGTNVTKTETFYRDAITYRYRVRVHPIPPDGLYTSWDYNDGAVSTYYNELTTDGVAIDGVNDEIEYTNVDELPNGEPFFVDVPDPTFTKPLAFFNWEQVSGAGDNGSLVYMFEFKNAQAFENPAVVPYYRDDACLDDGTGDNPSPRAYPGESYEWMRSNNKGTDYLGLPCKTEAPDSYSGPYRQGAFGSHGVHYFLTGDTDNAFSGASTTEIDGQQWQWTVPTESPAPIGDLYANTVKMPLVAVATPQG